MNAGEGGIVGSHAIVLQVLDGVHAFFGHILLGQHYGELFGAVVAEVDEDDYVALLNASVNICVNERLHKLVGIFVLLAVAVVAELYTFYHVVNFFSLPVDQLVVSNLYAVPTLVAVHGVEASDDAGNGSIVGLAYLGKVFNEAFTALGVGVAAVHEAMHKGVLQTVALGNFNEFLEMVNAGMYAAVAGESHQVQTFAGALGIFVGIFDFGILHDAVVAAGTVDFHQILIHYAAGTDVEVTYLRVAHLSVGQTYILATGFQL